VYTTQFKYSQSFIWFSELLPKYWRTGIFLFATGCGTHSASYTMGSKAVTAWANLGLPPSGAKVKNTSPVRHDGT